MPTTLWCKITSAVIPGPNKIRSFIQLWFVAGTVRSILNSLCLTCVDSNKSNKFPTTALAGELVGCCLFAKLRWEKFWKSPQLLKNAQVLLGAGSAACTKEFQRCSAPIWEPFQDSQGYTALLQNSAFSRHPPLHFCMRACSVASDSLQLHRL